MGECVQAPVNVFSVPWEAREGNDGVSVVVAPDSGFCLGRVPVPDDDLARELARHVVGLHNGSLAGNPVFEAYPPASWYSSAGWMPEQVLRRPWERPMFDAPGTFTLEADSQFGDRVFEGPDGMVLSYVMELHNQSLLPIR